VRNRPAGPWWVYVLHSTGAPTRRYVGRTRDLPGALRRHEVGRVPATRQGRPWDVVAAFALPDRARALALCAWLRSRPGGLPGGRP
jgi:predicted GIY-YIG superfamily endonuclease